MITRDPVAHVAIGMAAALSVLAWPIRPASADSSIQGRLEVTAQTSSTVTVRLTADGLAAGTTFDPASTTVTMDGRNTSPVSVTPDTGGNGAPTRRAVLVVDTSGSMSGAGVAGARQAAEAYLAAVPPDVAVGLVTFSSRARLVVAPTTAHSRVDAAVRHLKARGETSLYDAINLAVRVLGDRGERSVVILSDGADTRSTTTLPDVASLVGRSGTRVDAVAFDSRLRWHRHLADLATATGGRVTSAADAADLAKFFVSAAHSFAAGLTVVIPTPVDAGREPVHIAVSARSTAGVVLGSAAAVLATTEIAPHVTRGPTVKQTTSSHPLPTTALTLLFLGLAGLLWAAFDLVEMRRSPGFRTRRMLDTYTYSASTAALESVHSKSPIGGTVFSRALLALANRLVSNKERRDRLVVRLSRADVALRPGEWLVVQMLVTIVGFLFGAVLLHSLVAGLFLGAAGYGGSVAWLALKGRRRLRAFEEQLPNSLQMVAGSLRAGFSLSQSLDALVREGLQPIAGEVHRALSEVRLGSTVEDSLEHVADRMDSMEFRWVVMAIRIQHEVGGNLAEVLLNTSATMRERARLRRQVKALSAEGRLSAQILFGLPLVMALYMVTLRRAYIRPLYTEVMGLVMLSFGALLLLVGAWWMRKVVKVDA